MASQAVTLGVMAKLKVGKPSCPFYNHDAVLSACSTSAGFAAFALCFPQAVLVSCLNQLLENKQHFSRCAKPVLMTSTAVCHQAC